MNIILPNHETFKKALFIVDAQPQSLKSDITKTMISSMAKYIAGSAYDAFVIGEYEADKNSMFYKQSGFFLPFEKTGATAPEILEAVKQKDKPAHSVFKNTRSFFKGKNGAGLNDFLNQQQIQEIHLIGYDINDCVLATAYDAIDLGYYTYVLEDLCHHSAGLEDMKAAALTVLRRQNMTNRSVSDTFKTREQTF